MFAVQFPLRAALVKNRVQLFGWGFKEQIAKTAIEILSELTECLRGIAIAVKFLSCSAGGDLKIVLTAQEQRANLNAHNFTGSGSRSAENCFQQHSAADCSSENTV